MVVVAIRRQQRLVDLGHEHCVATRAAVKTAVQGLITVAAPEMLPKLSAVKNNGGDVPSVNVVIDPVH